MITVGLNKVSKCSYFNLFCNMIRDIRGDDHFYTTGVIVTEKHYMMIIGETVT